MPTTKLPFARLLGAGVIAAFACTALAVPQASAGWSIFGKRDEPQAQAQPVQAVDPNRLNNLEGQVRQLTGQVEELTHQLQTLQDQLVRMQQDNEYRFQQLEGGNAAASASPAPPRQPQPQPSPAPPASTASNDTSSTPQQQLGAPPKPLGQVVINGSPGTGAQPLDLSSLAAQSDAALPPNGGPPPADDFGGNPSGSQMASLPPSSGDPRADYDAAYAAFAANQYDVAEQGFRQFLANYPNDQLAPESRYWLGLSLFVRGDYQPAAEQFLASYKSYPQGKRAPDALLQLGLSQAGLGHPEESCKTYALALKQYPQISNALKQRIVNARATAGC